MKCDTCGKDEDRLFDGKCASCLSYVAGNGGLLEDDGGSELQYLSGISDEELWKEMLESERKTIFTPDEEGLCQKCMKDMGLTDREKDALKETIQLLVAKYYEQLKSKQISIGLLKNYGKEFGGTMVEKNGAIIVYTGVKY